MGVESCPLQHLDDLTLRLKIRELSTTDKDRQDLIRCLKLLFDRGFHKKGATNLEIYKFAGDVFCTHGLPIDVIHYACKMIQHRADHQLLVHHAVQRVIKWVGTSGHSLYNLDALISMIASLKQQIVLPPHLQIISNIHTEKTCDPLPHDYNALTHTMTDDQLQNTFIFHTHADPKASCRHCLRQTYLFWRQIYPSLRPGWMHKLYPRSPGLHPIHTYQKWFKEDQQSYLDSLDVKFNETDPWSLELTAEIPFFFLQRTTMNTASFHHLFHIFSLQGQFTATKGEATDPYNRSLLGAKNKTECRWSILKLRHASQLIQARSSCCGPSLTSCRKE